MPNSKIWAKLFSTCSDACITGFGVCLHALHAYEALSLSTIYISLLISIAWDILVVLIILFVEFEHGMYTGKFTNMTGITWLYQSA